MAKVVHFEINSDNPEKAVKFYEDVFGWNIKKWSTEYWMATLSAYMKMIKQRNDIVNIM